VYPRVTLNNLREQVMKVNGLLSFEYHGGLTITIIVRRQSNKAFLMKDSTKNKVGISKEQWFKEVISWTIGPNIKFGVTRGNA